MEVDNHKESIFKITFLILIIVFMLVSRPDNTFTNFTEYFGSDYIADDVYQHIAPFLKFYAEGVFENDLIIDYFLKVIEPPGYVFVMKSIAEYMDPRIAAKAITAVCYILTLVGVGLVGWRFGKLTVAVPSILIVFSSDAIVGFMLGGGGTPRTFAFPVFAFLLVGLAYGRPYIIVLATIIGGAFYYVPAVVGGLSLTIYLLLPSRYRGRARHWSLSKRLAILFGAGFLTLALIAPAMVSARDFGPMIGPERYDQYPESGPGGRYYAKSNFIVSISKPGFKVFTRDGSLGWIKSDNAKHRFHIYSGILVLIFFIVISFIHRKSLFIARTSIAFFAVILSFLIATTIFPLMYFPVRYGQISMPILFAVFAPWSVYALCRSIKWASKSSALLSCVTLLPFLILISLLGGKSPTMGLRPVLQPHQELYAFVGDLPETSLVAGWPNDLMDGIPYHAERRAFLTYETHLAFHEVYVREMRERMFALIDVFFSGDVESVRLLDKRFGVTHLVVDTASFTGDGPSYFSPFDLRVLEVKASNGSIPTILDYDGPAKIYEKDGIFVLDVRNL